MSRRFLYALATLLLIGLLFGLWYVSSRGFTRKWREFIVAEFSKAGVEVHIRRLTLDPFRGLVAKEVEVLDARDHRRVLAWVDEVLLGVNYANALRGKTFLDSADLRDANLWLPLDAENPDAQKVEISKLNARLYLPPQQIYIPRAQAEIHGIQVYLTGRLINPQSFQPDLQMQNAALETIADILSELAKVKYGTPAPALTIEFSGDLAHLPELQVDARFTAHGMHRRSYDLNLVEMVASCRHGVLDLQQLRVVDSHGEGRASGTYNLQTHELAAHGHSTLDLQDMDHAYGLTSLINDWSLPQPPELDLAVAGSSDDPLAVRVTGHVEVHHGAYGHVAFQQFATDFSWARDRWSLRGLHLLHDTGELTGDATSLPRRFHARLHSSLNPSVLAPLLQPEFATSLNHFDFAEPAPFDLEIAGTAPALADCSATGQIAYGKLLYDGAPVAPAHSALELRGGKLTVQPFSRATDSTAGRLPARTRFRHS